MATLVARALDQPLTTPANDAPVVAAPGAVAVADPIAAAPQAAPTGVVGRALGMANDITGAVKTQQAQDPLMQRILKEAEATSDVRKAAVAGATENSAQIAKLMAEPDAPKPVVPRLTPLPEKPIDVHKDPTRVLGQFMPVLVALGALTTSRPGINALNAATAAINAEKANDKEELARAHTDWLENMKLTVDSNQQLSQAYQLALQDRSATMAERLAKIQGIAAQSQDKLAIAAAAGGQLEPFVNLLKVREGAEDNVRAVLTAAMNDERERAETKVREAQGWARLEIERANAGNVSMGDAIGPLIRKLAQGGTLTAAENAAVEKYKDLRESGAPTWAAPAAAAPAAPATPAAAPAAPVDASVLKTQAANAKAAIGRGATRDQARAVWINSGLPPAEFDKLVR